MPRTIWGTATTGGGGTSSVEGVATANVDLIGAGGTSVSADPLAGTITLSSPAINDAATSTGTLWSSDKVQTAINTLVSGLDPKESCRAATTAAGGNVDLATGGLLTIDGVVLAANDRVLVKNQTATTENGIYTAAAGAWVRAPDMDGSPAAECSGGNFTFVEEGTQAQSGWVLQGDGVLALGIDPLVWTRFTTQGPYTGGDGIDISGALDVAVDGTVLRTSGVQYMTNKISAGPFLVHGVGDPSKYTALTHDAASIPNANVALRTVASSGVGSRTISFPDIGAGASETLVGRATTDTLTNKSISGGSNTFSNISADDLVDGTTNKVFTAADETKLAGIASGATNYGDADVDAHIGVKNAANGFVGLTATSGINLGGVLNLGNNNVSNASSIGGDAPSLSGTTSVTVRTNGVARLTVANTSTTASTIIVANGGVLMGGALNLSNNSVTNATTISGSNPTISGTTIVAQTSGVPRLTVTDATTTVANSLYTAGGISVTGGTLQMGTRSIGDVGLVSGATPTIDGSSRVHLQSAGVDRVVVSNENTVVTNTLVANAGISTTGLVDGRDVSVDGAKLDGIASGATNYGDSDVDAHIGVKNATNGFLGLDASRRATISPVTGAGVSLVSDIATGVYTHYENSVSASPCTVGISSQGYLRLENQNAALDVEIRSGSTEVLRYAGSVGYLYLNGGSRTILRSNAVDRVTVLDATTTVSNKLVAGGGFYLGTPVAYAGVDGDNNNIPTGSGAHAVLHINQGTITANYTVTGIAAPTTSYQMLIVTNRTDRMCKFTHENVGSAAANRLVTGGDVNVAAGLSKSFYYDTSSSRWRMVV